MVNVVRVQSPNEPHFLNPGLEQNRTGLDSVPVVDKMQRRDIIFKPLLHSALRLNNKSHRIMDTPVQCCSGADRPPFHDLSRTEGQEDDLELQVKLSVRPPCVAQR